MPKTKISEFDVDPANNTDINSINIAEGCAPSGINNAIRQLMSDLKEFQTGAGGDPFNGAVNGTVGATTPDTGAFTTLSASGTATITSLTASQAVFTDASDNLVSNAITGTGNVVMSASPTLTGTITAAAITASGNITGNGNWTLGNADTDTITVGASFVTGSVLRSAKTATNTLALAAYDVDGASYTNLITLTASNTPTLTLTSTGVGTINNMSVGATTASTGAFTSLSASGAFSANGGATLGDASGDALTINSSAVSAPNGLNFNSNALVLNTSGNLGLGVTPSAWASGTPAIQYKYYGSLWNYSDGSFQMSQNIYFDGSNWKYLSTAAASNMYLSGGSCIWQNAASGTSGATATLSERMRLDSSGNLGIGTSSPTAGGKLDVNGVAYFGTGDKVKIYSNNILQNAGTLDIGTIGSAACIFNTANTERMRIDSSGNLLVGTTSAGGAGGLSILPAQSSGAPIARFNRTSTTATSYPIVFQNGGSDVGYISYTNTAVAYVTSSDYRLKDNQAPLTGSGAFIDALQPKTWTWTVDGSTGVGFIAHEVQAVSPNSVVGEKDAVDKDGKPKYQAMEYGSAEFIANIIAELQDLRKRVAVLESK